MVRRLGEPWLAAAGGGALCVAFLMLGLGTTWAVAMVGAFLAGLGFYMIHNTLQTNATQMAPERRGASLALFASCLFVGSRSAWPAPVSSSSASERRRSSSAGVSRCLSSQRHSGAESRRTDSLDASMHTPADFVPSHVMPQPLAAGALAFAYRDTKLLAGEDETPTVPTVATLASAGVPGAMHYLGELAGASCVAVALADDAPELPGHRYAGLRSLFFKLPEPLLALAARAFQIADWDRSHRYCGRCGCRPATRTANGRRSAPHAGSSPIRACRRR